MMLEAEDEPLFADRAAGIDIAKAGIEVTIRVPSDTRRGGRYRALVLLTVFGSLRWGALLVDLWDDLVLPRAIRSAWAPAIQPYRGMVA
jgi:hypothetical protein